MTALPAPETFLSGEHGEVGGRRGQLRRAADALLDGWLAVRGAAARLDALAARAPVRDVLVTGVYRGAEPPPSLTGAAARRRAGGPLASERGHRVRTAFVPLEPGRGKFDRLNDAAAADADWLLVVDDDVTLRPRFLDHLIGVCEWLRLDLAQPAQTLASHAAWRVVRRRPFALARETRFVEIGPVTAFSRRAAAELLPFPPLRYGWGLDLHWAALADQREWRLGIVDALPVRHESAPVGAAYSSREAIEEAQRFLAERPYLPSEAVGDVLRVHR